MKKILYEHESKNSELEIQAEEHENDYTDKINHMNKELQKSKDAESYFNKNLELL